jgi:hypothetical protein
MDSTWENRDLPVLTAIAEELDREHSTDPDTIARATGLDDEQVQRALRALSSEMPPLFATGTPRGGYISIIHGLTGEARRRVGAWPTPENLAGRIVEALSEAAEQTANPQERTRLGEAGKALANVGQAALAGVIANALTGSPLGPA